MRASETAATCEGLEERVFSVKKRFLGMYQAAHAGHIGSSLSCAEILVFLRLAWMEEKDTFVLSKGHAAAALYSLLAEVGVLSPGEIGTFYEDGTRLPALPPFNAMDEIPFATGSLGYGLSLSAGMALGAALEGVRKRVFCVTSDGELNEGSLWEAALFIAHHRLTDVVWVIDWNQIQATGRTEDVLRLEPLADKLRAFGYFVTTCDGHDFGSLFAAKDACQRAIEGHGLPVVIIAETIKGHGISFMHDTVDCHYQPMKGEQYTQALGELTRAHEARLSGYRDAR